MKETLALFFGLLMSSLIYAQQQERISTHQEEHQFYQSLDFSTDEEWDTYHGHEKITHQTKSGCTPEKYVFGWHPYWMGSAYENYSWNLLTDLSYFSYEVNPNNGEAYTTHNWLTAPAVTEALNNGVRANLCVTLFSNHDILFNSATSQQTLIDNLIDLVQQRGAHGVNIDFESMAPTLSQQYTDFMVDLCTQMHAAIPGSQVSIALHAVDWSDFYDIETLNDYVDLFIIMGYDYYWSGSTTAGPNDPLYHFGTTYNYTLSRSITYYENRGAPKDKLLLGLPYYGREYTTVDDNVPTDVLNPPNSASRTYKVLRDNNSGFYTQANNNWEPESFTPYFLFNQSGEWKQCFYNTIYSQGKRYDMVNQRGLAGIGIWALGYDDTYTEYWQLIEDKFTDCAVVPCTDTIYDMGGPYKNYYNNEDWTYTIQPDGATSLELNFNSFSIEAGDELRIYDGEDTNSPLIGAYSGTNNPGNIQASGNALTLYFQSDGSGTASGFMAIWDCETDNIPPTTSINPLNDWETEDFTVEFTDEDQESGIQKSFYQVSDFNGSHWYANADRGFFRDQFTEEAAHWTSVSGNWLFGGTTLTNNDETEGNTNIYAALNQNLSNRYLYHWTGRMAGSETNRRGGLHFFADDPELPNRGNSYFAWFRIDDNQIQLYKVNNDVFSLEASMAANINANQWYDYKVAYDRVEGSVQIYLNDELQLTWVDEDPYLNGDYISFRSGNCIFEVDDLQVYRTRYPSVTVTVGDATADIRYQNNAPAEPAARIRSIVQDNALNLSEIDEAYANIDWTEPLDIDYVYDGTGNDIDTTYSLTELSGNYADTEDPHSGILRYWVAMGTEEGEDDIYPWTDNGLNLVTNVSGLTLTHGEQYWFSVKAENNAGLETMIFSSDGQVAWDSETGIYAINNERFKIYPSPFVHDFVIEHPELDLNRAQFRIYDLKGALVDATLQTEHNRVQVNMSNRKSGLYFVEILHDGDAYRYQVMKMR